jgi:mono/diheme cytochrome c family protein
VAQEPAALPKAALSTPEGRPVLPPKASAPAAPVTLPLQPQAGETIVLLGNTLGEREQYYGFFETALHQRFPAARLTVRNLCFPGDTPSFRPRAGHSNPWAFPGAERFRPELKTHNGRGHEPRPDEWLHLVKADTIIAFFGFNESFDGIARVDAFKAELSAFVDHTLSVAYNGKTAPRLVLVTPIAFEDRSADYELPKGVEENKRLAAYAEAVLAVAKEKKVGAVDLFTVTKKWFDSPEVRNAKAKPTINGCHLSEGGYAVLSPALVGEIFGKTPVVSKADPAKLRAAINDKAWLWFSDYRIVNGVHVYGQRWNPFGSFNYPEEIEKTRQMTLLRDERVWEIAAGKTNLPPVADHRTRPLTEVKTNFNRPIKYLTPEEALKTFTLPEGYKIECFASEKDFPALQKPMQMSFDNQGRLWVATMPAYPHYLPGGPRPDDKILILEDTNADGKADKTTIFAEGLHLPIGFELQPEGVYVSEEPNVILLKDTNGDSKADSREIVMGGFDSHDTHHAIHAYHGDRGGAVYLQEGRFLHSQVETPYGPQRMTDGGSWRFEPKSWRLQRYMQTDVSNPWGLASDYWGQNFLADASGGDNYYSLPLSIKVPHGKEIGKEGQFTTSKVRPTSGAEFISSRHFPDEVQGDFILCNAIGFLGIKQHTIVEDGAGFTGKLRHDLLQSSDPNFRPADLEFAPDGSLYLVDWHNALIGHMQHSIRDPNRDHMHGRIYRITYPARPLIKPALVAGAPLPTLLENLKLPEDRVRYRTQRELRGRPAAEVLPAVKAWAAKLDKTEAAYEHHLLEALWATWGQGNKQVDSDLLELCLGATKHQTRAAAVNVLRYCWQDLPRNSTDYFLKAARDEHPRVRLEALAAASWMDNQEGAKIAAEVMKKPLEKWMRRATEAAMWTLGDDLDAGAKAGTINLANNSVAQDALAGRLKFDSRAPDPTPAINLTGADLELYKIGEEVFKRDAHCATCHQPNGQGMPNLYPSLVKSPWVEGDEQRLVKIILKGLWGPIEVNGQKFDPNKGTPPMMGFGPLLTDKELAGVATYVRNTWGNKAPAVKPEFVARLREQTKDRANFYMVDEILKEHPLPAQ